MKSAIKTLILLSAFTAIHAGAAENITLQLKWHHQFQFAGYYAAKELGYYKNAGLNVDILPVSKDANPIENVINGHAQYGVGSNDLLLIRNSGNPVVALAVIIQHSPYVLISPEKSGIQSIHDIIGKRIMLDPYAMEITAYLKKSNIPTSKVVSISKNDYTTDELMSGEADAYAGYSTNDPYYFEKAGIKYSILSPRSEGIDFYGDNLFTTESEIKNHPERTRSFLNASLKGWNYALSNPEKTIDLMISKGYAKPQDKEKLLYEANKLIQLIHPELISVGYMNKERWQHIVNTYAELGMLPKDFPLSDFLYEEEKPIPNSAKIALTALLFFSLAATAIAIKNYADRRMLFTRLFQSNNRFEKVVSSVSGGVFLYRLQPDGKSSFPYFTKVLGDLFCIDSNEFNSTPQGFFKTLHEDDKAAFLESLETSKNKLSAWQVDCRINPPASPMVWIHINAIPEKEKNGAITWHGVITDITDKKSSELALIKNVAELKAAERHLLESRIKLRDMAAKRELAREEERRRIAHEVHDELGQLMSVLRLNIRMFDIRYGESNPDLHEKAQKTIAIVDRAIKVVRNLATKLRPAILDTGIGTSLEWMIKEFSESTDIDCRLNFPESKIDLDEEKSIAIFRIVQESLTNALRHAEATLIEITLQCEQNQLQVTIQDNGKGFDPIASRRHNAYGILGMQERVLMHGGTFELHSAPGEGTRVCFCISISGETLLPLGE